MLKIEVRSITRVLASIWVKLDDLSFLYYTNDIICVIEAHILVPNKYNGVLITNKVAQGIMNKDSRLS